MKTTQLIKIENLKVGQGVLHHNPQMGSGKTHQMKGNQDNYPGLIMDINQQKGTVSIIPLSTLGDTWKETNLHNCFPGGKGCSHYNPEFPKGVLGNKPNWLSLNHWDFTYKVEGIIQVFKMIPDEYWSIVDQEIDKFMDLGPLHGGNTIHWFK